MYGAAPSVPAYGTGTTRPDPSPYATQTTDGGYTNPYATQTTDEESTDPYATETAEETAYGTSGPAETVTRFFDAINRRDYDTAWELGGKNLDPSYSSFVAGFATTQRDDVTITSVDGETVSVNLLALQTDGTQKSYSGRYTVVDGVITRATMASADWSRAEQPPWRPTLTVSAPPNAASDATRLLCAGTHFDPVYRAAVIRELLTHRYRVVAPSYGYDAVLVLAHALAARRLQRVRLAVVAAGAVVTYVLMIVGFFTTFTALLAVLWLLWATAYFRRLVTLQLLVGRLRPGTGTADGTGGFDGAYPEHPELTSELVSKDQARAGLRRHPWSATAATSPSWARASRCAAGPTPNC